LNDTWLLSDAPTADTPPEAPIDLLITGSDNSRISLQWQTQSDNEDGFVIVDAATALYTEPPAAATVLCLAELGPVIPRTFPPAPGWTKDGQRVKAPLDDSRGPEQAWVYGAPRVRDGQAIRFTSASRKTAGHPQVLALSGAAHPDGDVSVIADNLASHTSPPIQAGLEEQPRVEQVFIPKGACWLTVQEPWWRFVRREAYAGQGYADPRELAAATAVATAQLNARAQPWVWGRPPPMPRQHCRRFLYRLSGTQH
jgi:hypothetical protein